MAYVDYEYYKSIYGEAAVDAVPFNRLCWIAEKKIDIATTGIDGFKKLKQAFPIDTDDSETVKRCICALIMVCHNIEETEKRISLTKGYTEKMDGTFQGKVISSVSSGSESITYASASNSEKSIFDIVVSDKKAQEKLYYDTIKEFLSGTNDANGVNLLYMGKYPYLEVRR